MHIKLSILNCTLGQFSNFKCHFTLCTNSLIAIAILVSLFIRLRLLLQRFTINGHEISLLQSLFILDTSTADATIMFVMSAWDFPVKLLCFVTLHSCIYYPFYGALCISHLMWCVKNVYFFCLWKQLTDIWNYTQHLKGLSKFQEIRVLPQS